MPKTRKPTASEFAIDWHRNYPRPARQTTTTNGYMVRGFAKDFAGRALNSITRAEAKQWALRNPSAARYVRTMFNDALDDELVDRNPFLNLRLSRPVEPVVIPETEMVMALIEAAPEPIDSMIRFAAFTGLRLGETLALTIADISADLGGGLVNVERQLDKRGFERPPKTGHARRVLVPAQALPVPVSEPGERLWRYSRSEHHRHWSGVRKAVGYEGRWHSLRHHCASWWLDLGAAPIDLAVQLGHFDSRGRPNPTQIHETYGNPDPLIALERLRSLAG